MNKLRNLMLAIALFSTASAMAQMLKEQSSSKEFNFERDRITAIEAFTECSAYLILLERSLPPENSARKPLRDEGVLLTSLAMVLAEKGYPIVDVIAKNAENVYQHLKGIEAKDGPDAMAQYRRTRALSCLEIRKTHLRVLQELDRRMKNVSTP